MADKDDEYPSFEGDSWVDRDREQTPGRFVDRDDDNPLDEDESLDESDFDLPEGYPLSSNDDDQAGRGPTATQPVAPAPPPLSAAPWDDSDLDDFSPHDAFSSDIAERDSQRTDATEKTNSAPNMEEDALNKLAERDLAALGEDTFDMPELDDDSLDAMAELDELDDFELDSDPQPTAAPEQASSDTPDAAYGRRSTAATPVFDEELSRDVDDLLREQDTVAPDAHIADGSNSMEDTVFPNALSEAELQDPFDIDDDPPALSISDSAQRLAASELAETAESDHDDVFGEERSDAVAAAGAAALGASRGREDDRGAPAARSQRNAASAASEETAMFDPPGEGPTAANKPSSSRWPLVLIGVAAIALLLVGIGGYGVLQERSALQEEIRKLQARMATAVSQEEARANRLELQSAAQRSRDLEQELERVQAERARINEQLVELQAQSSEQAERLAAAEAARRSAEQSAASAQQAQAAAGSRPNPSTRTGSAPAATTASGDWFVNFGSYAQRAVAERWQSRLQPEAGRLLIQEASSNGRPLYRLRVVGLADRDSAERVARQLERNYEVERLWVGKDSP